MVINTFRQVMRGLAVLALMFAAGAACAVDLNMPVGVTPISHDVYGLHMYAFWVCAGIGIVVFGLILISIIWHRKSAGHQAAQFHESTVLEVVWTIIPFIILIALAIPAAKVLVKMTNTSDPDMTIKITGFQWKWNYAYLQDGFSYFSMLAADSNAAAQLDSGINPDTVPHYLRDVDHPLVVPVGKKVRLLITSDDVIHSWYVADFAAKTDAIPGFVNETWIQVDKPGTYRGGCTELCGRGHGFMPIVVVAMPAADYQKWVTAMQAGNGAYINPASMQPESIGSPVVFSAAELNFNAVSPVAAGGNAASPPAAAPAMAKPAVASAPAKVTHAATGQQWTMATAMAHGKQIYAANCAACHMPDGKGNAAMNVPAIADGPIPNGPLAAHISLVLHGKGIMPPWGNILNDADLAAVITFERNAFGNHTGDLVQPSQIKAAR